MMDMCKFSSKAILFIYFTITHRVPPPITKSVYIRLVLLVA